ncbi:MAG: ABC transporter permease [Desulfitobacteriaceae bacterium]|nr:ABC transporter permease [Desulfitobacteriaceae bacterium]MDD4401456.1 ABC transporter permease [Desulfitobacteriaceae bacterium]
MTKLFANTGVIALSMLRRDRIRIPVWIISITLFVVPIAALLPDLYTTSVERQVMAESMRNPAITFMLGPGYGLDNYTDGAMMAHFMLLYSALIVAIMSILLVARHTREDEDAGRIEMVRSLPVGLLSNLTAAFLVLFIANIVLSVLVGFGLYALGFETMDLRGSLIYGASMGAVGVFFAALTCLFAQLASSNLAVLGYSFGFLIVAYIVRGIGDMGYEVLSLITPLGLILRTEVYVNDYWWPVLACLAISIIIFALSLYLYSIRDLGAGFISTKPGRKNASGFLSSPLGLALRLQRTSIIAWMLGMFVLGAAYGSILGDLEGFLDTSGMILQMIPEAEGMNVTERFITMLITILTILGAIPILLFILRLNSEESDGRTGHLLARAVSRNSILGSYTFIAIIAAPIIQLMSVFGLWSAAIFVMEDVISLNTLIKAALVHLPAMWIMVGLAVFLIGFVPRLTGLVWVYLGYSFFIVYLGEMLQLPDWMAKSTPFGHIPQVPIDDVNLLTLAILMFIAIFLIAAGFIGYNKRDIR